MASVESPFKALAASAWLSTPPKRLSSGPWFWNTCRSPSTSTSLLNVHWLHTSYMLLHMSQLLITAIISCESVFKHIIHPSPTATADSASSVGGDNNTTGWGREGEISFLFFFKFVQNWMSAKHRLWNETSWTFMFNLEFTEPEWITKLSDSGKFRVFICTLGRLFICSHVACSGRGWSRVNQSANQQAPLAVNRVHGEVSLHKSTVRL